MLVTVDTGHIDLVHNTEVLEAALNELPAGWIVDLEFFKEGTFSFVKTHAAWFVPSDGSLDYEDPSDFISTIQGDNHLKKEAMSVAFRQPEISDVAKQQNEAIQKCRDAVNGEMILDNRFIKYRNFFLDMENDLKPIGLLAVANNIFLKEYQDDHDFMKLFTKKGDEK
uniref:Uncharacterized protein n=1 Tax=Siphoviridae sp. ctLfk13 TaxID=2826251 RepID=A0A8S5N1S1_9CAUD|nr:MAG TPA: hypothetical protein [Siphoviridae sp. ctLfk13]